MYRVDTEYALRVLAFVALFGSPEEQPKQPSNVRRGESIFFQLRVGETDLDPQTTKPPPPPISFLPVRIGALVEGSPPSTRKDQSFKSQTPGLRGYGSRA